MSNKDRKESSEKNKWQQLSEREQELGEEDASPVIKPEDEEPEETREPAEGLEFASRKALEDQLTAVERKAQESEEKFMRVRAEMDNLRKKTEREVAQAIKFGTEKLVSDLLPVMDSLVRALESPEPQDPHAKSMREGLSLTLDLLDKTLLRHGVQVIDPKMGDPFNPAWHEAVSMQKDPQAKPNTILKTMQKGYLLNDRVLRAAMVIVAG